MTKYYITLEKEEVGYNIFVLGYDKGGGYFISDLSQKKGTYHIARLKIKLQGFGQQFLLRDPQNEWVVSYKPKLMCHFDGSCQVSGKGIRSGFFKLTGKPKGVATKSPRFNDGGPIFTFLCWGLDSFSSKKNKNLVLFNSTNIHVDPYLGHKYGLIAKKYDAYLFEGFYLPRQAISHLNLANGIINFKHPNFGIIPLKYIPPPKNSPGFIAIGCRPSGRSFRANHGFTYSGGVSLPDKKTVTTHMVLIFPFEENKLDKNEKSPKNLEFNFKDKIISYLDNLVSRLFRKNR